MQMAKPTSSHDERDAKEYCISDIFCRPVNYKSRQKTESTWQRQTRHYDLKKNIFYHENGYKKYTKFHHTEGFTHFNPSHNYVRNAPRQRMVLLYIYYLITWPETPIRVDMKTAKPLRNYWRCRIITNGDVGRCTSFDFYSHRSICCSMKMYLEVSKNQHTLQNN